MTIRDWSKADQRIPDPGAVVAVRDTGGVFCGNDARPFVPNSVRLAVIAEKARRTRARKKLQAAKASSPTTPARTDRALQVPLDKAHLIMSVMKDLGKPMPGRIRLLNKQLRRLIKDGVISAEGDLNTDHPLVQRWHLAVEMKASRDRLA